MSYQLRGTAVLLFCDGEDAQKQARTRRDIGPLIKEECRLYVDPMERLALTWAQPGPEKWLLRADLLARALTLALERGVPSLLYDAVALSLNEIGIACTAGSGYSPIQ